MENCLRNWAKQAVKISQLISVKPYFQLHYSYTSSNASNQFILMVVITVYLYGKGHLLHFQRSIVSMTLSLQWEYWTLFHTHVSDMVDSGL